MRKINIRVPSRDDRGVSPVIGVILMVAITVILAAVIASFVLGFGDQVSQNVQAGADIQTTDSGNATVTWISEGNAVNLSISTSPTATATGAGVHISDANLQSVGETATVWRNDSTGSVTVTVIAWGAGGTKTVVVQEDVTLENQA